MQAGTVLMAAGGVLFLAGLIILIVVLNKSRSQARRKAQAATMKQKAVARQKSTPAPKGSPADKTNAVPASPPAAPCKETVYEAAVSTDQPVQDWDKTIDIGG